MQGKAYACGFKGSQSHLVDLVLQKVLAHFIYISFNRVKQSCSSEVYVNISKLHKKFGSWMLFWNESVREHRKRVVLSKGS
jgi:hypothetical protein